MEVPDDQGLLVVNLDNCISNTAGERVMKSECVYAVAVASNTCDDEDGTVIQIPVSVHCSEGAQQQFTTVTQLDAHQHYGDMQAHHYTQINVEDGISCLEAVSDRDGRIQDEHVTLEQQDPFFSKAYQRQCEDTDSYYGEIYNYLNSQILPDGATESYKKLLKKKAYNYKISNGILYYGHKDSKRVITQRNQQIEILKDTHVDKHTGVHLGLKKMYIAINDNYFWKGLYVDVANYVRQCKQCSESALVEGTSNEEIQHLEHSKGPDSVPEEKSTSCEKLSKVWQKVELNVYGPYPRTANLNEFIITIADPFSRWIVARPISSNYFAESISSFVFKTFCTFGFAKCSCIGLNQEIFEAVISKYHESISQIQDTLLTCGSMVNTLMSMASAHNSLSLIPEELSQCVWVRKLWDDFVAVNLENWDLELERFLFKYCTSASKESVSPFSAMFDRSPVSCLEEDKENCNIIENAKPVETVSKRRRLQSSILQCRHCEEIFTSKISFRIHQRKHTEEARRQGTLEGQEPLRSTSDRERKLLRRTALKRKQRILKHGITKKDQVTHSDAKTNENISVEDHSHFDENTNSASNVSETGLLSVDTDSIQNISSPSTPVLTSNRNCEEETFEENSYKDSIVSRSACDKEGQVDSNDRSNDLNLVVYTDVEAPVEIQDNMQETNGENLSKIDQNNLIELRPEIKNNSLPTRNKKQNEHGILRKNADSIESFQCHFCGRKFNSKIKLGIHIEKHSNPSLECTQCSYTTESSKLMEYHQNIHNEKFKCKFCNKLFTRRIYLKYHIKDIHRKDRRLHNCEECNAKFLSLSGLKMHIQSVHEPDGYSCPFCSYVGKSTNSLSCHITRRHKKKYKCNVCEYESLTQGGLDKHAKIYHNPEERQFACKHCSYRGKKRRQLLDHERTVHGQLKNKHLCPVCKKSFKTQVLMKHHLPSHSDRQLYSCKGCSYRTRFRQTLHLHIKNSHPGENFKTLGKGPSDADFEEIIQEALQNLELFPPCVEQNMEVDYITQVPEDCHIMQDNENFVNISSVSEHTTHSLEIPSHNIETCTEEVTSSQILTLQKYKPQETTETELTESCLVTEEVVESMHDLNTQIVNSDHTVTVIGSSEITNSNIQTVVNFGGDLQTGKDDVQSLFPLNSFNLEDGKIHQVVTLVDNLNTAEETNQQTVMLLNNVVKHKGVEHNAVTHISLVESHNTNQENLVILPLGDAKVAIIQNENFSAIQGDNQLVLGDQSSLLDLIPDQNELIHQTQENVNQVTVYLPP